MGRNATFTRNELLRAALSAVSRHGAGGVTISSLRVELGVPTGSIYHRYGSIRVILAEAWLSAVESFQAGVLALLRDDDAARGGVEAALFTARWSREHPLEARTLLCYRREDLVSGKWPREVKGRAEHLGRDLREGMEAFIRKRFKQPTAKQRALVRFALIDMPCAAVRPYLEAGKPVPDFVDDFIYGAYTAAMDGKQTPG